MHDMENTPTPQHRFVGVRHNWLFAGLLLHQTRRDGTTLQLASVDGGHDTYVPIDVRSGEYLHGMDPIGSDPVFNRCVGGA